MFKRLTKVFYRDAPAARHEPAASVLPNASVSEWAATRGLTVWGDPAEGQTVSMYGKLRDFPWRMEVGNPSRDYIHGQELRARAELGLADDVGALIIHRPVKQALERRAYSIITDTLQTTTDPRLYEEMRWLAIYDEVGWKSVPDAFWARYAVHADQREHGPAWVDEPLVRLLMDWPASGPSPEVPFMLVLRRGKCYLRMQYEPADTLVLEHATRIFKAACGSALAAFGD
jgi:hypothetical protein